MALPLLFRKRLLAAKVETTLGTYESITASTDGAFRVQDRNLAINSEFLQRQKVSDLGNDSGVAEVFSTALTLQNHLCGNGSDDTPPLWASTFLRACGFAQSSSVFQQSSDQSDWKTISAIAYQDGKATKARGLMGNLVMTFTAGRAVTLDWNLMGGWVEDPADVALPSAPMITEARPPLFAGSGSFTFAGSSSDYKISTATLDCGVQAFLRQDANAPGGFLCGFISNFQPTLTLDPEGHLVATRCWQAAYRAGTEVDAKFTLGTGQTGNQIEVEVTDLQPNRPPEDGDRDGKLVDNLGFQVNGLVKITFSTPEE